MTMFPVLLVTAWVASCLPHVHTLDLWADPRSYFHYVLTKECFGEEIALQQEKDAMQRGEYCAQMAQGKDPLQPVAPLNKKDIDSDNDYNVINPSRARRALVKLPRNPSLEVILCNIQEANLLTNDNQVNFTTLEVQLQAMKIDPQLKLDLLESAISCRPTPSTLSFLREDNSRVALVSTLLAVTRYQRCFSSKSLSICKEFALRQVASKLQV